MQQAELIKDDEANLLLNKISCEDFYPSTSKFQSSTDFVRNRLMCSLENSLEMKKKPRITSEVEDTPAKAMPPGHPRWIVTCVQEDGSVLEEKIEKVEVSIDGILPTNITNTVPTTWYTDLYMQFVSLKMKLDQKCYLYTGSRGNITDG
ncbi:hypothetical protein M9H77_34323 [Catharanthus roseus]|uniref:Uncharacterized protein n=1 Tax=Catharanthus roseus TaxID=4058 RepID=A0ACB9ZL51_CATRO|nr:hypothetical protein M9H77_34323 [Catharanthus roseus]